MLVFCIVKPWRVVFYAFLRQGKNVEGGSMKQRNILILLSLLGVAIDSVAAVTIAAYRNTIIALHQIDGHTTSTLVITTQSPDPIITYAPNSYQESLNDALYRAFMPNTIIADNIEIYPQAIRKTEHGVEILCQGKLLYKKVYDNVVMLTLAKADVSTAMSEIS